MTRKDYILLASALRDAVEANSFDADIQSGVINAANQITYALSQENPRFDATHFMAVVHGEKPLNSRPARKEVR